MTSKLSGQKGFLGYSEPRVLRRHLLAGQLFQPSVRLALNGQARACKARTLHVHREASDHIPGAAPGAVARQE